MSDQSTEALGIGDYLAVLRRHTWLIVVVTALAIGAAAGYTATQPKVYISRTDLLIRPVTYSLLDVRTGRTDDQVELDTERELAQSSAVVERARNAIDPDISETALSRRLTVASNAESNILVIRFAAPTAREAQAGATEFATAYAEVRQGQLEADIARTTEAYGRRLDEVQEQLSEAAVQIAASGANSPERAFAEASRDTLLAEAADIRANRNQLQVLNPEIARTVSEATLPASPSSPNPTRDLALGAGAGLLVAIMLAFVRDRLDDRLRTTRDVEAMGIPVLGHLPMPTNSAAVGLLKKDGDTQRQLYRLRAKLLFHAQRHGLRTVLVAGAGPLVDATTVTASLARALADVGHAVVLVSADLHRPRVNKLFRVGGQPGLAEVLRGKVALREAERPVSGLPTLRVVVSGRTPNGPDAANLVASEEMARALAALREDSDYVVVDGPPLLSAPEALSLAAHADGVILVIDARRARRRQLLTAIEELSGVGAFLVGVVLNRPVALARPAKASASNRRSRRAAHRPIPARPGAAAPAPATDSVRPAGRRSPPTETTVTGEDRSVRAKRSSTA